MRASLLSLMVVGGAAAADIITAAAQLPDLADVVNAINPDDPGYTVCTAVSSLIGICVDAYGSGAGFAGCACCADDANLDGAYSLCSSYLEEEGSGDTGATVYGSYYSYCGAQTCDDLSGTSTPETTTVTISTPPACGSVISIYDSCSAATSGFATLANVDQASCFCCDSDGDPTNAMGDYASTCAYWARTSARDAYDAYTTYAKFCSVFSDVCPNYTATKTSISTKATTTSTTGPTAEGDEDSSARTGSGGDGAATPTPTETGAASGIQAPFAGGFIAVAAVALFAL